VSEQPTTDKTHWELDRGMAQLVAALRAIVAALVNESGGAAMRQNITVLREQLAAKALHASDVDRIQAEQLAQDDASALTRNLTLGMMERDETTLHDLAKRVRALEAAQERRRGEY